VKVYNGRDGEATHNDSIELPFGAFVGADTSSVDSAAVAVGAGSAVVECALPLAVAECKIVDDLNKLKCASGTPQRMVFASANADAVGFINMYYPEITQAPSGNWAADTIRERRCNPKHYRTGPAKLQNGDDFSKVIEALRGTSGNGGGSGGDSGGNGKGKGNDNGDNGGGNGGGATGPCLIGEPQTLAVTDAGCPGNPIFQNVQEVVGFVTARIVAVTDVQGNLLGCPGKPLPDVTGPFKKNSVIVDITCEATAGEGEWGGGRAYSSSSDVRVRLVD